VRRCWICGAPANSREHKIKRSDLVRRYGRQSFQSLGGMMHFLAGEANEVQGPSDKRLTYAPLICSDCNGTKSQPWDKAYAQFERWVFEHSSETLKRRFILMEEVFGSNNFSAACPALYKYFVKAFGCRLVNSGMTVPDDLVSLLPQSNFRTKLRLTFAVNKTVFLLEENDQENYLGLGDLIRMDSRSMGMMERYLWHMQIGWLRVWFFYNMEIPCGIGSAWTSDSACVYLGEFETVSIDHLIEDARRNGRASALARLEALRNQDGIRIE
jgi:hypothetical protein